MREPLHFLALHIEISQVSSVQAKHNASNIRSPSPRLQNYTFFPNLAKKLAEKVAGIKNNAYFCSVKP